jgi:phosphotransferase system  glucose/maltose/N-acetylglucosamine-specific IIC component
MSKKNKNKKKNIVPKPQSNFLYTISFFMIIPIIYALYKKQYDIAIIAFIVFCTSIQYWENPKDDWKRALDRTCVALGSIYILYKVYRTKYMFVYYGFFIGIIIAYLFARYYKKRKMYWYSVFSHSMVHLQANIITLLFCYSI